MLWPMHIQLHADGQDDDESTDPYNCDTDRDINDNNNTFSDVMKYL